MAERFNITAQLQLQAPNNVQQVGRQIQQQLKDVSVNIKVQSNARQLVGINKAMADVSKSSRSSAKSMGNLNRTLAESARRFSVITVATGTFIALARSIKNSV